MSRIGKLPINIPKGVDVEVEGQYITVGSKKGKLVCSLPDSVGARIEEGSIIFDSQSGVNKKASAEHGLARALVNNMVVGVSEGFKRSLVINGVGYRVEQFGRFLRFYLGYSHPIFYELPDGIEAQINKNNTLDLTGVDKDLLGRTAATIRSLRKPEPYKGKGIRYSDEVLLRKAGKAGGK